MVSQWSTLERLRDGLPEQFEEAGRSVQVARRAPGKGDEVVRKNLQGRRFES